MEKLFCDQLKFEIVFDPHPLDQRGEGSSVLLSLLSSKPQISDGMVMLCCSVNFDKKFLFIMVRVNQ